MLSGVVELLGGPGSIRRALHHTSTVRRPRPRRTDAVLRLRGGANARQIAERLDDRWDWHEAGIGGISLGLDRVSYVFIGARLEVVASPANTEGSHHDR